MAVQLTMLNSMASQDFAAALDHHLAWRLKCVDLKDSIFGKSIDTLLPAEAKQVDALIRVRGLQVYCLSTSLMHIDVAEGEARFQDALRALDGVLNTARTVSPSVIRLLSPRFAGRTALGNCIQSIRCSHAWLFDVYRQALLRIQAAGFVGMIENEAHESLFSTPDEIVDFFAIINLPGAKLIWDVVNLWQMGCAPSLEVYQRLRPLIGGLHLKGGRADEAGSLKWASSLEDASWPVLPIVRRAIADGVTSVICLNPPHGQARSDYNYADLPARDLAYLRRSLGGLAA